MREILLNDWQIGDGGRETAKMLQFKINPIELFKAG